MYKKTEYECSAWNQYGMVWRAKMSLMEIGSKIQEYRAFAAKVLKETGADHVLYAVEFYEEDDLDIREVHFYMFPMSEELFEERVSHLRRVRVYTLHKHQ